MKRNLTCIVCPRGCSLTAERCGNHLHVTGHSCPRGERYAIDECTHPMRTVTTIVRVANRNNTMLSVKTTSPIPKENIDDALAVIHKVTANAPVQIGDVIVRDLYGSDIVATKQLD